MTNYVLSGKAMIIILRAQLIKKTYYKSVNIFQNQNFLEQMWKLD